MLKEHIDQWENTKGILKHFELKKNEKAIHQNVAIKQQQCL